MSPENQSFKDKLNSMRHPDVIWKALSQAFPWKNMPEEGQMEVARLLLEYCGVTLEQMDEDVEIGIKNGYSPEAQINLIEICL